MTDLRPTTAWYEVLPSNKPPLRRFWRDFRHGVSFGFPLCCILRFAVDSALTNPSFQAIRRGSAGEGADIFVPCGIFHHPDRRTDDRIIRRNGRVFVERPRR